MSNHNKNTIAKKALMEMDDITAALKEESKKSLNVLLTEAVKNALREECEDDDDCEILDGDKEESPKDKKKTSKSKKKSGEVDEDEDDNQVPQGGEAMPNQQEPQQGPEMGPDGGEEPVDDVPAEDPMQGVDAEQNGQQGGEDDVFSKYQVGDNTYDLTGEKDQDAVVKVYKLLNNDDNIVVRQDGDTIQLTDNESGTEYVIDFGDEDQEQYSEEPVQDDTQLNEHEDFSGIAGFPDDDEIEDLDNNDNTDELYQDFDWYNPEETEDLNDEEPYDFPSNLDDENLGDDTEDIELDLGSEELDEFDDFDNNINENRKARKPMKKNKNEVLFEIDLGYTDNYQDKDPIAGLSNNEPAKGKKDWDAGVPKGTKKPFAGDSKSKGTPFEDTVNEEDEMMDAPEMSGEMEEGGHNVGGAVQQRTTPKSAIPDGRKNYGPNVKRHVSTAPDGYKEEIVAEMKKIKKENKQLKESVKSLLKNLNEAYVTNYNLGKITKLFVENVTTQEEKVDIVNRFANDAKTVKQSNALFESIQKELQKSHSNSGLNLNESSMTAKGTKQLNEVQQYASKDLLKTRDLMNRILEW